MARRCLAREIRVGLASFIKEIVMDFNDFIDWKYCPYVCVGAIVILLIIAWII
jgi:hypothetical protein